MALGVAAAAAWSCGGLASPDGADQEEHAATATASTTTAARPLRPSGALWRCRSASPACALVALPLSFRCRSFLPATRSIPPVIDRLWSDAETSRMRIVDQAVPDEPRVIVRRTNRVRPVTGRRCNVPADPCLWAARRPAPPPVAWVAAHVRASQRQEVTVLIAGFPAGSFAANCYIVAPGPGEECLIIDPGQDAEAGSTRSSSSTGCGRPPCWPRTGTLITSGPWRRCAARRDIPAYIHPADRDLLTDPAKGLSLRPGQQLFGGLTFTEPDDVRRTGRRHDAGAGRGQRWSSITRRGTRRDR